ncbi:unnamed protein product [Sympodiomycopsis kandeliae]
MNSYPLELTHHAYASMFVAGLVKAGGPSSGNAPTSSSSSAATNTDHTEDAPRPPLKSSPNGSAAGSASVEDMNSNQPPSQTPSSPVASGSSSKPLPSTAKPGDKPSNPLVTHPVDRYPELCRHLADVFAARGQNVAWDPARGRSAVFHSVLVDHHVRLPPRKTRPSSRSLASPADTNAAAETLASLPPRSPLSPLHPASPLFPDGLIAPIWVRKHREIVPSVFVAFHCLADSYAMETATSEQSDGDQVQSEPKSTRRDLSGPELKARDEELINLIAERKRSLLERGIKMTVVLLTERDMLESQQLEARLSFIRRSSGLDSKASLFVLTPISRPELGDFVTSLQAALYDHALDYYRESARRVRRKRTRYPPPPSIVQPVLQAVTSSRPGTKPHDLVPLSREGWHVRAEFKLAMFAEWHSDYEMALSHYREAYDLLAGPRGMLGSTMLLPPRTKRWAEAKVLSDTLSIRITRLLLYADDGAAALAQFKSHISRFVELSSGWGIGDATFEFWSWLAKQYRLMGDLVREAVKENPGSPLPPFELPVHISQLPSFLLHPHIADNARNYPSLRADSGSLLSPNAAAMASGIAPGTQLQGAGAFYYLSALCSQERRQKFIAMKAQEEAGELSQSGAAALVHEKKVDHWANIIEALSRAHDIFKTSNYSRLASFTAVKIASTYAQSEQHAMALRFVERLIKAHRAEGWSNALHSLIVLGIACAEKSGDNRALAGLLLEGMAMADHLDTFSRDLIIEKWQSLSKATSSTNGSTRETSSHSVTATFDASIGPIRAQVVFRDPLVRLGEDAHVQITLQTAAIGETNDPVLKFDEMKWFDANGQQIAFVKDVPAEQASHSDKVAQLGSLSGDHSTSAHLGFEGELGLTFGATIKTETRSPVGISSIILTTTQPGFPFEIVLNVPAIPTGQTPIAPLWRSNNPRRSLVQLKYRENPAIVTVDRPWHNVVVEVQHHDTAFIDELVIFKVSIQNKSPNDLQCNLDVSLQQAFSGSQDELAMTSGGMPTVSGQLKNINAGVIASQNLGEATFTLKCRQRSRLRSLRIVTRTSIPKSDEFAEVNDEESGEKVNDVTISILRAFRAEYSAFWRAASASSTAVDRDHLDPSSQSNGALDDATPRSPSGKHSSPWPDPQDESSSKAVAIAHLCAAFAVLTTGVNVQIRSAQITIDDHFGQDARVLTEGSDSNSMATARKSSLQGQWSEGDRWSGKWQIEVALKDYAASDHSSQQTGHQFQESSKGPTGRLTIEWGRSGTSDPDTQSINVTQLPLPILAPPHLSARVLVASPPVTHLYQAFTVVFVVVNPSSSPVDIIVYLDEDPAWSIDHRTLSIPGIPARGSRSVPTRIVPRAEGIWTLPRARAFQQRSRQEIDAAGGMPLLNETQHGLPIHVRFRASAGATLSAAASRAIAAGQVSVEQEGPTLSILVLRKEEAS